MQHVFFFVVVVVHYLVCMVLGLFSEGEWLTWGVERIREVGNQFLKRNLCIRSSNEHSERDIFLNISLCCFCFLLDLFCFVFF